MSIVARNKNHNIFTTSTQPNQIRFRILNTDSTFKIRLSMHYFTSMRIDLYKNDIYIAPSNAQFSNGKMTLIDFRNNINRYMPTYMNESGTNLYVKADQKIYFTISGGDYIDLKIAPVLFVKFGVPAITADEFFEPATLVQNFADLLGVDPSKIRNVQIVRATRTKRQTDSNNYITFEISNDPVTSLSNTALSAQNDDSLKKLTASITNQVHF
jgi:hypothetical protein